MAPRILSMHMCALTPWKLAMMSMDFFAAIGQAHPSHNELCQQRGAFFYQHRSRVGVACAQACALRIGGPLYRALEAPLKDGQIGADRSAT